MGKYGAPNGSKILLRELGILAWSSGYLFGVRYTCLEFDILVWSLIYFFEFERISIEFVILFLRSSYLRGVRDTSFRERDACLKWIIVRLIRLVAGYFLYVVGYFFYVAGYFLTS